MRRKYIYYRGDFSSQFSLPEEVKLNKYSKGVKENSLILTLAKKELNNPNKLQRKNITNLPMWRRSH